GQGYRLSDSAILFMLALTVISLWAYQSHSRRVVDPVLPLLLFKYRTVTISSLVLFISFIHLVSLTVLVPMQLQMLAGLDADAAALRLIALSFAVPVGATVSGYLMSWRGTFKYIQLVGTLMVPAGVYLLSM